MLPTAFYTYQLHMQMTIEVRVIVFSPLLTSDNPIECWLGIVENNIDRRAFRPDDVVYAVTGDSIEIVHSDAEG